MTAVRVVTDSTASIATGRAVRAGVITVPLQVVVDGVSAAEAGDAAIGAGPGRSGVGNITGSEVAAALRSGRTVTTSRPSAEAFAAAYQTAAEDGAEAVVSLHLSQAISGTYEAAVTAARQAPVEVTVLDSATLAMALGFAALGGAAAAAAGASPAEVAAVMQRRAAASTAYFSVDSLDYLRRGGRIGAAAALLGSALAVKPLLTVAEGVIQPYERVRTRARAVARLEQLAVEAALSAGRGAVDVAVHHLADAATAEDLAARLTAALRTAEIELGEVAVTEISAVLGVHTGPGMLGVIVAPRLD